ncbi:2-amino-4-hydroxy-6-hydroxymethyldihydropteridine diphosphokinase [Prolixibacteraceae bacterium JC049]|nr:2-amino-4-hydroxy-6-hydroxymethyldihydropteridine diphosphokinase [Prolixibacteraceae bacterium JC049]
MRNTAIIGIGSNINPEENIYKMLGILENEQIVIEVSSFIRTQPIGIEDQPEFVNGAVKIQTLLDQSMLDSYLKKLEDRMGRDRSVPKFGPRNIDLDIVIWNGEIVDNDYHEREFLQKVVDEVR